MYSFFDLNSKVVKVNENVELTIKAATYDESYNIVNLPVSGVKVIINGEVSTLVSNDKGVISLTFDEVGTYVISATSDTSTLVPPVCVITVEASEQAPQDNPSDDAGRVPFNPLLLIMVLVLCAVVIILPFVFKKKGNK